MTNKFGGVAADEQYWGMWKPRGSGRVGCGIEKARSWLAGF